MAILGPYTGDPDKAVSYLYGPHWKGSKGFMVVQGESTFHHRFGGETWTIPECENCHEPYHQIITFDLHDPSLTELKTEHLCELPLISCLNCSTVWEQQVYKLDTKNKSIEFLSTKDTQRWMQGEETKFPFPLPEVRMKLLAMNDEDVPTDSDSYYRICDSFGEESICRVLGAPLYAQSPVDRECPLCQKEMKYIATLGSQPYDTESAIEGVDFFIGEMYLYFLLCKDCMVIKTECQGT